MSLSWTERGSAAVNAGDLPLAKQCFTRAVKAEDRNAAHRFHLAVVLESLGEFDAAAHQLTHALRIDARHQDAARRLAALQRRADVAALDRADLNVLGLRNALQQDRVDRQAIAALAIRTLAGRSNLKGALDAGASRGWLEAARALCLQRSGPLLKDELFLDVLRQSLLCSEALELLLTAVRRVVLLELPADRFSDGALATFAVALMQQCRGNDFVWAVSAEEAQCLAETKVEPGGLALGDIEQGRRLLKLALYRPVTEVLGGLPAAGVTDRIQPHVLRDAAAQHLAEERDERERAARMRALGSIDATRGTARSSEHNPHPRWSSDGFERDFHASIGNLLGRARTTFLQRPFEMLIAGCGTGRHAVHAAIHYGPNARILALDPSAANLGYAARMVQKFGIENVEFAQADLAQIGSLGPDFASRFQVIECLGALPHLADPWASWRSLLRCLAPRGLMRIGLYSTLARGPLIELRTDPAYPGAGCSDAALRSFRQDLLVRRDPSARDARTFIDFWAAGSFRDLLLNASERHTTLPEIARFLETEHLAFLGFVLTKDRLAPLWQRYPQEPWPGALQRWAEVEADNPSLFQSMYQFWVERA